MALPLTIALKTVDESGKYLGFISEDGFLKYGIDTAINQRAKFLVENAGNGLVHIICAYNNKYWARKSENEEWISAIEKNKVDDQSAWNCTLFRPDISDNGSQVTFYHVQSKNNVGYKPKDDPIHKTCLCLEPLATTKAISKLIDYDSLVILPKLVSFKGDNDQYLSITNLNGSRYLQYKANDIGDEHVRFQVFTTTDGHVRIKSEYLGRFWRHDPSWIKCDSTEVSDDDKHSLFEVFKVDDNIIALRSLGNNSFVKRLTKDDKTNCLNAAISSITHEARIKVEEPVFKRTVNVIDFRLNDARIYDKIIINMASGVATNPTNSEQQIELEMSYEETTTSSWSTSISLTLGFAVTFTSGVPALAGAQFTFSAEFTAAYEMGKSVEFKKDVKSNYTVKVPPHTKTTVKVLATKAHCDIPFDYLQVDYLTTGERKTAIMDDGVYKGINTYNFDYETSEEKLN